MGKAACAFLPLVFKKMSWQRHVLASRGYLELGMFDDASQAALEQIRGEDKALREVLHASLVTRQQRIGRRPSRLPQIL